MPASLPVVSFGVLVTLSAAACVEIDGYTCHESSCSGNVGVVSMDYTDCGASLSEPMLDCDSGDWACAVAKAKDACESSMECKSFGLSSNWGLYHAKLFTSGTEGLVQNDQWSVWVTTSPMKHCNTDTDCSLNGLCNVGGTCECDTPWTGDTCGVLSKESARSKGVYGFTPNISSWGGNIVHGDDGQYHLFVAEMTAGGLRTWNHDCQCIHATSPTMSGPFAKADVSVGKWCHNPAPIRDPRGEYLLFHIGDGADEESSSFMHHSSSPTGPWMPAKTSPGSCNNPAPAFHPNGTLFLICNHMHITSAPSWDEEWQPMRSLGHVGGDRDRRWEDPTLWFDRRGNWHILYHVYCLKPFNAHKECYSGHAFSEDGFDWTFSDVEPFNGTLDFVDGTSVTFSTRERPQVIFAHGDSTTPVGFVGGVSSQPIGPMCDSCYKGTCSQCKITQGRDWVYTVLQPLQGFADAYPESVSLTV